MSSTILASDTNLLYSPTNWYPYDASTGAGSGAERATINPGAYLKAMFSVSGTLGTLSANFDTAHLGTTGGATPASDIAWRVDDGPWTRAPVTSSVTLTIPSDNTWSTHVVEIVFLSQTQQLTRWGTGTTSQTAVVFKSLTNSGSGTMTSLALTARARTVWVFGDSITEGVRTLSQTGWATDDTPCNNALQSWSYPLGDLLGAEVGVIGFGGQGVVASGAGGVPVFGSAWDHVQAGASRSMSPAPDVVVINEGTNDGAAANSTFTAAYISALNDILTALPSSTLIFILVPFAGTQGATSYTTTIKNGVSDPSRIHVIDTTGWWNTADASDTLHPYGYVSRNVLGPKVAAEIKPLLPGPGNRFYFNGTSWANA